MSTHVNAILVLGFGHPEQGMGETEGNWETYIYRGVEEVRRLNTINAIGALSPQSLEQENLVHEPPYRTCVVFSGGPLFKGKSEAQDMRDSFMEKVNAHNNKYLFTGVGNKLEEKSINTFENFKHSRKCLRELINDGKLDFLVIVGGDHKPITYWTLSLIFFPRLLIMGGIKFSLVSITQKNIWKDILGAFRYISYLVPYFGQKWYQRDVQRKRQILNEEGKNPPH